MTPEHLDPWTTPPGGEQRDPRTYVRMFLRWKYLFLAFATLVPLGIALTREPPPVYYEAGVLMQIRSVEVDTSLFSSQPTFSADQNLKASARLIRTTSVAAEAAKLLKPPPPNPRSLLGQIVATPDTEAGFITISATDAAPQRAADVANAFAAAVIGSRQRRAVFQIDKAIARIREQLGQIPRSDLTGRAQLSQELQRLRAVRAAQEGNASVIEPARASASPVLTDSNRSLILGIIVGILLGVTAVFLAEYSDRRCEPRRRWRPSPGFPCSARSRPGPSSRTRSTSSRSTRRFRCFEGR